jgi:hypothetical protein
LGAVPETIQIMTSAYEDTLRGLGLADRSGPITEIVAKKIIEVAELGERDPDQLRQRAFPPRDAERRSMARKSLHG